MPDYKHMDLDQVIDHVGDKIMDSLSQKGHELEYPDRPIMAILSIIDKAVDYAASGSLVGFAVASSFLIILVKDLKVELPSDLEDRLHGRIDRG